MSRNSAAIIEEFVTSYSPIDLFEFYHDDPYCFFLDSGMGAQQHGRFSFMGSDPFLVLKSRGKRVTITRGEKTIIKCGNPFEILRKYMGLYSLELKGAPVPFIGGAVGYLSYDLCHHFERLPKTTLDDLRIPELYLNFYDIILAHDNLLGKTYLISSGFPESNEAKRLECANKRLTNIKKKFTRPLPTTNRTVPVKFTKSSLPKGNFTHRKYLKAVKKARQFINDGDIFEVNLSQRFETEMLVSPWELYRSLRAINPAPFAAYLGFEEVAIVSASPERFLKVNGKNVETRPIKGTIRRGQTPEDDYAQAQKLLGSVKDHAENMMIVDLERNDLGRVCEYGSVKVSELAILEAFPTVFHLTSTVLGKLRDDVNLVDLLRATFPGGSITGAPKIRSMEIIDELEPTRRSVYTGSIGYFSYDGNIDINIVIRTFIIKGKIAYFQVGGAVVFDSDPEEEYQETLVKAKALIDSLKPSSSYDFNNR